MKVKPMIEVGVTTLDNHFDPIDDFDRWWNEDRRLQHRTLERLSILGQFSDDLSVLDEVQEMERTIKRMMELFPHEGYRLIKREKGEKSTTEPQSG